MISLQIEKHYWLFDPEKYDVDLLAVEYHLTPTANIMDLTENEMKEWIKNNAPSGISGEYMTVYDPPVNVDRNFDWSAKKGTKTLKTRESILEEFGKYITDYAEFKSFKKEMELFSK